MLNGKVAVITGGTRGIGYATAKKYLENGAKVAIFGSKKETVDRALASLRAENTAFEVEGYYPDLLIEQEVDKAIDEVVAKWGRLDILVNNAGVSARDSIYNYSVEDFQRTIDLNVNAVFISSKKAAQIMKKQGGGVILNTSSMVSLYAQRIGSAYPTSKFAVNGLTKSLARELGKDGIRVNAVAPGIIETDMVAALDQNVVKSLAAGIPLQMLGKPQDIANAFLFLASDMSSYITGAVISVDGGFVG